MPSFGPTLLLSSLAIAAVAAAGCAQARPPSPSPTATGMSVPSLPAATDVPTPAAPATVGGEPRLTCGGGDLSFPVSALTAPGGAETAAGPVYDGLRALLEFFGTELANSVEPGATWRLVAQDGRIAIFLTGSPDDGSLLRATVDGTGGTWKPAGFGTCNLRTVPPPGTEAADWTIDPAFPVPDVTTTTLHLLVWERACNNGQQVFGRIALPQISVDEEQVTINLGVTPRPPGDAECPMGPGTPFIVTLPEPLGERTVMNGGAWPVTPAVVAPSP